MSRDVPGVLVLDATGRRASAPAGPLDPRAAFDALFKKK